MNDRFSKTCLAMMVGLLAVIAFKPRGKKLMLAAPVPTGAPLLSQPVPGPGGKISP
jgi:hypothetical protein